MGELRSKSDGKSIYYILNCNVAGVTVTKAFMQIVAMSNTDDFYLNIPDQPIRFNTEK